MKKVLVISGTPRPNGNSFLLSQAFAQGAEAAGNKVTFISLAQKKLGFCTGCYSCQKTGHCHQQDDANAIVQAMLEAEVIVLSTPVYYYSVCAQLKTVFDRSVVVYPNIQNKTFWFLMTMADDDPKMFAGTVASLQGFVDCCENSTVAGMIQVPAVYEIGAINGSPALEEARKAGASIK